MAKTNTGLVAYAEAQLGKPYWYGCYGQKSTKELYSYKKKQYPVQYQWACPSGQLGIKVHDCVGLIKGYLWCDSATDNAPHYAASQDVSANGMLDKCKEKGPIGSMPDIPGILVFLPHHVGVYIGNGYVVEAKGHAYGVVKTKLKGRGWTHWGKCPFITYTDTKPAATPKPTTTKPVEQFNPNYRNGKRYKVNVKTGSHLMLRKGAGTDKEIILKLPKGTEAIWYGYYIVIDGKTWKKVVAKGKTGWVCADGYLV